MPLQVIGYRSLVDDPKELIKVHDIVVDSKSLKRIHVTYKGDTFWAIASNKRYPKGTFNQEVTDVPYMVLDNNVYELSSFEEVKDKAL